MKSRASLLAEIEARLVSEAKRLDGIDAALTGTTPSRSSGLLMAASIVAQKRVALLRAAARAARPHNPIEETPGA